MHLTLAGCANGQAIISLIGLRDLIIRICRHSDLVCTTATHLGSSAGKADSLMERAARDRHEENQFSNRSGRALAVFQYSYLYRLISGGAAGGCSQCQQE